MQFVELVMMLRGKFYTVSLYSCHFHRQYLRISWYKLVFLKFYNFYSNLGLPVPSILPENSI